MNIFAIFKLIGGLALFLYGMSEMNKHLTSIAGARMKVVMVTLTKGRFRGYLTGLGITMINQSSSATTVLEAALVGAGLLTFQQSLAVTLGAELGSTFLPQLVAFPSITKVSTLIAAAGLFTSLLVKTKAGKHTAMTIFTFGLLFLGMDMTSTALTPLRTYDPFISLMRRVETPILGILFGMLFTMIIQSSGATTGITIAMAMAGTISLEQAVPINLGAAVGTCITAVLGSLALNWEAKRSAYIHVLFQLIGVIWVYILLSIPYQGERLYIWMLRAFCEKVLGTESLARQIAMGFTFMPVINHIIVFPCLDPIVKLFNKVFPEREGEKPFGPKYIIGERLAEGNVGLALVMARKEILRVGELVSTMLKESRNVFQSVDESKIDNLREMDGKIDILHKAIIPFLARLSQEELSKKESLRCMNYLYIQNDLESIGDVIDKNILVLVKKKLDEKLVFSKDGTHELEHLLYKLDQNFKVLLEALKDENFDLARRLKEDYNEEEEEKYKKLHMERLASGKNKSIATSSVHLDLINYFTTINGHISYIADRLLWLESKKKKLKQIEKAS